jgi:iron complex outermembrane recepter protein
MRFAKVLLCTASLSFLSLFPTLARAEPVEFDLPSQSAANALLAFSQQAKIEVLFPFDLLRKARSTAVVGSYEPETALVRLLSDTGFIVRRDGKGKFIVSFARQSGGSIKGRLLTSEGNGAGNIRVTILETHQATKTNRNGEFQFDSVVPGVYRLTALAEGYQRFQLDNVSVEAKGSVTLETRTLQKIEDLTRLDPYVVQGKTEPPRPFGRSRDALPPRDSVGNIDLPRTENDALPYTIYDREQIVRSGVVGLNEFLQRSVLESDGATPGPVDTGIPNGTNLSLRGFKPDETVVLVNGRRLPEVLTDDSRHLGPDVNFIPLSLIQQVEVLPVSASALYSGNAVGGVINIILRPDLEATEVNATYTNAAQSFDAPQSSISLLHGRSLLGGKLHLRLNASFTHSIPPVESELGYHQAKPTAAVALDQPVYRATPNVRSADGSPLFGAGTSSVTSVAPAANGSGGIAAFNGREGLRNLDLFDASGGLTASINSLDYAYGRRQERSAYFGSLVYDVFPWLQLGLDGTYVRTVVNRGYDVLNADLTLDTDSPFNPFKQPVKVSLNEITPLLGENYSEARLELSSAVVGALIKLPADWQVSLDAQYARNITRYRGLALPDTDRWQQLVNDGLYNPLRDTQLGGPPATFYDRALVYYGGRGKFSKLGDFQTLDAAVRVTNRKLSFPTGQAAVNVGGDYRRSHIDPYTEVRRFGDGSLAGDPVQWTGRTLQRYSAFGEIQAPLVPVKWLPRWLHKIEADLAVRYVAADTASETNIAPTIALKADLGGGYSLRGSLTTSSRFPTPVMSQKLNTPGGTGGTGSDNLVQVIDPRRDGEDYQAIAKEIINTGLSTEDSVTQTAGMIWQRGKVHRFRVAVDFVDTRKVNELVSVTESADVLDLESVFPERIIRAPLEPGDMHSVGRVTTLYTGILNLASRHSQNWSTALDYVWTDCLGGTLEVYGRWLYFARYDVELTPGATPVDELSNPDGAASGLLRHRVNFGTGWSTTKIGLGVDGHYFDSRALPFKQWAGQGSSSIKPYWQFDAYLQGDLSRYLPWKNSRYGLRGQLRVNNISGFDYPKYAGEGSGVQPYGDWRGRTYSVSITATF